MSAKFNVLKIPSLRQFMANSQSLGLYRKALRVTRGMEPSDRKEVTSLIRHEFETTRSVVDPKHVAFLQTSGKRRIEQLETQLAMQR